MRVAVPDEDPQRHVRMAISAVCRCMSAHDLVSDGPEPIGPKYRVDKARRRGCGRTRGSEQDSDSEGRGYEVHRWNPEVGLSAPDPWPEAE